MKKFSLVGSLLLTACVTINIYFPAAAADKVADEIIKGIQETPDKPLDKQDEKTGIEPEATNSDWQLAIGETLDGVLNIIIPPVHAAEANLAIDTAEIRQLRAAMQKRFAALRPYYQQGFVGIRTDGFLVVRNPGSVPLKDRNKVKKLVAAENRDRKSLYQAIANANGHPEWFEQIKSTFAKRWLGNARSGWSIQGAGGGWSKK